MTRKPARKSARRPAHRIRYLCSQQLADGTVKYHWKPSPRLRKMGWKNHDLGTDLATATTAAIALNHQLDASLQHPAGSGDAAALRPRYASVSDAITAYRASSDFADLARGSRKLYGIYLGRIEQWAEDGRTAIAHIDAEDIQTYQAAILKRGPLNTAINHLRVLRLFFRWARVNRFMTADPAADLSVPSTPSRKRILDMAAVDALKASAQALKWPSIALAIDLGLWTLQRQGDLLALPETAWRMMDNIDPADAPILSGTDGNVRGFRLQQQKTGAWIDAPLPPALHAAVQGSLTGSRWVIPMDGDDTRRRYNQGTFQNRFRKVADGTLADAVAAGDEALAAQLTDVKFHDLRRTGMCMYGDLGVPVHLITALSGHSVLGKKTILDTYMPGHTKAACAAVAMALLNQADRDRRRAANQKD